MKEDWIEVELGEICFTTSGGTPSRNNLEFYQGSIPWVKSGELDKGIIYDTEEHISEEAVKKSSAKIFPEGSLLIALYGATIGKLAFLGVEATTNQAICGIYKSQGIESKFLYNFLLNRKQKLISQGTGGAQPNISQTILKKLPIPLAPLPIQRAIVSKIESLFSDLDNGIANFKKAKEQLKIYRQAVLKKAFEGELTKEWRENYVKTDGRPSQLPTAEQLLKQIKEEREKNYELQITNWKKAVKEWEKNGEKGKKPSKPQAKKELPHLKKEELEELSALPMEWEWFKLGNFMQSMCLGKMLDKAKNQGEYKPYLGNINVRWGMFNLYTLKEMRFLNSEIERFSLIKGDLIICEGGEPGRCAIWKSNDTMMIQKALHRVRFHQAITNSSYIFHFFKYSASTGYLENNFTGTTIKHLTGQSLEKLAFPICSFPEQTQIVQEIEFRLSVCDKMEQSINESILKAEALRQSILKKAFEGKLLNKAEIEQCKKEADYEPASELLKKIKAEKLAKEEALKKAQSKKKIITKKKSKI